MSENDERSFDPHMEYSTLVQLLRRRASEQPDAPVYTFLDDGEAEGTTLTFGGLDRRARLVAARLQRRVAAGARALLLYPPGEEYVAAFFGCLYAGVVAVPAYPPRQNQKLGRLQAIAADAQPGVVLTTARIASKAASAFAQAPGLRDVELLVSGDLVGETADEWRDPAADGDTLAYLQYTSGSTGAPKGVMISHRNILHNEGVIQRVFGQTRRSVIVSWLPVYHDMGLVGTLLQPLYVGARAVLMPPSAFLQRPARWLEAISRYRATTSGGPNFAYDLCVRKVRREERAALDLSSWAVAFNGAEPVRHQTLVQFAEAFGPCGFRREAFYPCYGLAEATLIVSGRTGMTPPTVTSAHTAALEDNKFVKASPVEAEARPLVGCGQAPPDQRVLVVEPQSLVECGPGRIGEIWLAGPSVSRGYWNNPEATEAVFRARLSDTGRGPYLRTGDLGFLHDGELFITGRLKDLIIIRGRNLYPQDIEQAAEQSHPALRPNAGAAFSVDEADEEQLVVVHEVEPRLKDFDEVLTSIRRAVAEQHEVLVYAVVLLRPGTIPKTSSGKVQRHLCRAKFMEGSLEALASWRATAAEESEPQAWPAPVGSRAELEDWLRARLAEKVGADASDIDINRPASAYGIDSLAAIDLAHRTETGTGVSLPMETFLEGFSLAEIAARVWQKSETGTTREVGESPHSGDGFASPSRGQQALWYLQQLSPESAAYNIASAQRIRGMLDVAALRRAFQSLVDRHPSLRTTFPVTTDGPVRRVQEDAEVSFEQEEATAWGDAELDARLADEAHRPFDLQSGPLLRVSLFRRSGREHVLLLVVHHIAVDFWSLAVLTRELRNLYTAETEGVPAQLPLPATTYDDYVRRQEKMLSGAEGERHWAYWREQLAGPLSRLNLPTTRSRPRVQTYRGASHAFALGAELTRQVKELGRRCDATLYMTLLAAFQTLLHRYTGQADILVGTPTAGRGRAETADVVGYFVNPVVLRADISASPTFGSFLRQVRATVLDAFKHQDFPFALLVERLQPERDPGHTPLFQVMFILHKAQSQEDVGLSSLALGAAGARLKLGTLELEALPLERRAAQFDLTLTAEEEGGCVSASLDYNADLFDPRFVARLASHLAALLGAAVADPSLPIHRLPLLSAAERERLLVTWNDTAADYPADLLAHRLFEAQAERTPDAPAVEHAGEVLSYAELNGRANRLARYLQRLGVGPETCVGLSVERGAGMVVALLGILKAGGAYVPLDPSHPKDRIAFVLEDARTSVLVTQSSLASARPEHAARVVLLDADSSAIARESGEAVECGATADGLAYTIYTSGSTGRPKGVMVSHRALVNFLAAMARRPGLAPEDVLVAVTTLSFDIAGLELLLPLCVGARVCIADHADASDGAALARLLEVAGATVMQATPATWRMLLDAGWQGRRELKALCGGEALPLELANELVRRCAVAWNMYGPTETTVWSAAHQLESGGGRVPVGRPIANTTLYVLDAYSQPAPIGVSGELYIGGDGLARGYYRRPDLTAERFLPDPYGATPGARLYRTGDLARRLPDGSVEFLGRADHQVKVRGFRIELGEIEMVLEAHDAVRQCLAVAQEEKNGERRLVAYVVGEPAEAGKLARELRQYLKDKLPEYMIPSAFVLMKEFPLMPNGKVHRGQLPRATWESKDESPMEGPRTPSEDLLLKIWKEVLGIDRISFRDNFFVLGGHSLLATQIMSRVREALGVEVPLSALFTGDATLAEMAAAIDDYLISQAEDEDIKDTLQELNQLSDVEVRAMLDRE